MALGGAVDAGEGDEAEVHRVEHQLDRHEDHDRVAAKKHPCRADREQECRQVEVVRRIHGVDPFPSWLLSWTSLSSSMTGASMMPLAAATVLTSPRACSTLETASSAGGPRGVTAGG